MRSHLCFENGHYKYNTDSFWKLSHYVLKICSKQNFALAVENIPVPQSSLVRINSDSY